MLLEASVWGGQGREEDSSLGRCRALCGVAAGLSLDPLLVDQFSRTRVHGARGKRQKHQGRDVWPVLVLQRLNKSAGSEASASPAEKWEHFLPQGIDLGASGRQALCHRIRAGFGPRNSPVFSTHQQMGHFIPGTLLAEFRARCYNLKFFFEKASKLFLHASYFTVPHRQTTFKFQLTQK